MVPLQGGAGRGAICRLCGRLRAAGGPSRQERQCASRTGAPTGRQGRRRCGWARLSNAFGASAGGQLAGSRIGRAPGRRQAAAKPAALRCAALHSDFSMTVDRTAGRRRSSASFLNGPRVLPQYWRSPGIRFARSFRNRRRAFAPAPRHCAVPYCETMQGAGLADPAHPELETRTPATRPPC